MSNRTATTRAAGQALIPDAMPAQRGDVSDRARKQRWIPKSHTAAERSTAVRIIAHWNRTFAKVDGAMRAHAEGGNNIRTCVRVLRAAAASAGAFPYGEPEICAAITLYRNDPANVKLRSWKRFADWIDLERIDKYGSQIADQIKRDAQRAAETPIASAERARAFELKRRAGRVMIYRGIVEHVVACGGSADRLEKRWGARLREAEDETRPTLRKSLKAAADRVRHVLDVQTAFEAESIEVRSALETRAAACFKAHHDRDPADTDAVEINGIAMALYDWDRSKPQPK